MNLTLKDRYAFEVDAMLKMRFIVVCVFTILVLCGCSSENSSSDTNKGNEGKKIENPINRLPDQPEQSSDNEEQQDPALPSRSELRVISEQVKMTENEAKDVIEQFDANLGNREAREDAEAKFKKMLPGYKKQMLQLGKSKLKEAN